MPSEFPGIDGVVAGKYRVERLLGKGGMGRVYLAEHLQLGQKVAIKALRGEMLEMKNAVPRFLREARAAAKLRSEHVGRVLDFGTLESGAPYFVMEHLDGRDMASEIKARGALPAPEVADYVLQTCEALAEAHSLDIIHRDVKPANLFLTSAPDGSTVVKVLDFGISKAPTGDTDQSLTATQSIMGSPRYMSPEQLRSARDVDVRTDIWSLGVTMYQALTGEAPYRGENFSEVCLKVAMDPTPEMNAPGVPEPLKSVVSWCMQKDRAGRPANVAVLAAALAPFAAGGQARAERVARVLSVQLEPAMPPTAVLERGEPNTTLTGAASEVAARSVVPPATPPRRVMPWVVGTLAAVAAGVAIAITVQAQQGDVDTETPARAASGGATDASAAATADAGTTRVSAQPPATPAPASAPAKPAAKPKPKPKPTAKPKTKPAANLKPKPAARPKPKPAAKPKPKPAAKPKPKPKTDIYDVRK